MLLGRAYLGSYLSRQSLPVRSHSELQDCTRHFEPMTALRRLEAQSQLEYLSQNAICPLLIPHNPSHPHASGSSSGIGQDQACGTSASPLNRLHTSSRSVALTVFLWCNAFHLRRSRINPIDLHDVRIAGQRRELDLSPNRQRSRINTPGCE